MAREFEPHQYRQYPWQTDNSIVCSIMSLWWNGIHVSLRS